jgi:hypothetical protein
MPNKTRQKLYFVTILDEKKKKMRMSAVPWESVDSKLSPGNADILNCKSRVRDYLLSMLKEEAFDMLNYIYSGKQLDLYSNLSTALHLLLTLPVSVASGERSFSALKLIKNYMRSTMGQERLTGLALTSMERDVRRSLDMEDIVVAFAEANAHKHQF